MTPPFQFNADVHVHCIVDVVRVCKGGYNRNLTIGNNEFFGLGGSAMASWGDTSYDMTEDGKLSVPYPIGPDGRQGNQPRGCQIVGNIVSEVGMWEKQSSAWFQVSDHAPRHQPTLPACALFARCS